MSKYNGKIIYNPSGKAGEYSYWAANFFVGCSNDCEYCYCKTPPLSQFWSNKPRLKKALKDYETALDIFAVELDKNIDELKKHGLFFSFTSDPFLNEISAFTITCIDMCIARKIPVKTLTKRCEWLSDILHRDGTGRWERRKNLLAFGFTLTGHDELEGKSCNNKQRLDAMATLHSKGYKTWASIEPIITLKSSGDMIMKSYQFCDLFKIGIKSGMKEYGDYKYESLSYFITSINHFIETYGESKIYWKDETLKLAGINRAKLEQFDCCVGRDYNLFKKTTLKD